MATACAAAITETLVPKSMRLKISLTEVVGTEGVFRAHWEQQVAEVLGVRVCRGDEFGEHHRDDHESDDHPAQPDGETAGLASGASSESSCLAT